MASTQGLATRLQGRFERLPGALPGGIQPFHDQEHAAAHGYRRHRALPEGLEQGAVVGAHLDHLAVGVDEQRAPRLEKAGGKRVVGLDAGGDGKPLRNTHPRPTLVARLLPRLAMALEAQPVLAARHRGEVLAAAAGGEEQAAREALRRGDRDRAARTARGITKEPGAGAVRRQGELGRKLKLAHGLSGNVNRERRARSGLRAAPSERTSRLAGSTARGGERAAKRVQRARSTSAGGRAGSRVVGSRSRGASAERPR